MAAQLLSMGQGLNFVRDRVRTCEWWIIPIATVTAAEFARDLEGRFYTGDNAELLDVAFIPWPTPDVPLLSLAVASKSCLPPDRLAKFLGVSLVDKDILVHPTTPL